MLGFEISKHILEGIPASWAVSRNLACHLQEKGLVQVGSWTCLL